jgi:hypothetical protein
LEERGMTRGRKILAGLVAIVALAYGAFVYLNPTVTFNYRLTIEAMTPDGPKTGSGVIQVSYSSQCCIPGFGTRGQSRVTGEAVYVDLGRGKNLFVTLTDKDSGRQRGTFGDPDGAVSAQWLPTVVFRFNWNWGDERELARQLREAKTAKPKKNVPLLELPTVVTFHDLNDPKSVGVVDPRYISRVLGEGHEITGAFLEFTDEPPTERIESILPWWNWENLRDATLLPGEKFAPLGSPRGLIKQAFKAERGTL